MTSEICCNIATERVGAASTELRTTNRLLSRLAVSRSRLANERAMPRLRCDCPGTVQVAQALTYSPAVHSSLYPPTRAATLLYLASAVSLACTSLLQSQKIHAQCKIQYLAPPAPSLPCCRPSGGGGSRGPSPTKLLVLDGTSRLYEREARSKPEAEPWSADFPLERHLALGISIIHAVGGLHAAPM